MSVQPIPAATVVLLRDCDPAFEVFMLRRHQQIAFMGGAYVFPGGRVDSIDHVDASAGWISGARAIEERLCDLEPRAAVAHGVAAVRELFEEAGVLLARSSTGTFLTFADEAEHMRFEFDRDELHDRRISLPELVAREDLTLALDELVPFAHWVTPAMESRRFDARFFVARVPEDQHPVHDTHESTESQWITPRDALDRARRGEIWLPVPTWQSLRALEPLRSVDAALEWARVQPIVRTEPLFHRDGGTKMFLVPGDPLFPTEEGQFVGEETRFVFDGARWTATKPPAT